MKIEALLFDLGKVLIDFDFNPGMDRLWSGSHLTRQQFQAVVFEEGCTRRYERGELTTAEYHRYLCETGGMRLGLEEFVETWSSVFLPEPILPESFLGELKREYPLILVSNTNEAHVRFISTRYRVLDYFDRTIFSHEVGSMKPERRIYEAAIAAAGKPPEALFFTDDRPENVEAARQLGIHAHQFVSPAALVDALLLHGVSVKPAAVESAERKSSRNAM